MARFLVATIPVVGHVVPMVPIVEYLVSLGHEVQWYSGRLFEERIGKTGAQFLPMVKGFDFSIADNVPPELSAQRQSLKGLAQLKFDLEYFFVKAAIGHAKDLMTILDTFPADGIVADSFFLGAAWANELGGPPWAQLGVSVLTLPGKEVAPFGLGLPPGLSPLGRSRNRALDWLLKQVVFRDIRQCINEARSQLSLPPTPQLVFDVLSPYLYLASSVPSFEYPRSDLPPQVHFIGPAIPEGITPFEQPDWWPELSQAKTVVHVTQGTVATDPEDLILPTIRALAEEDVLLLVTTGNQLVETLGNGPLPSNVRVAEFIPHSVLLPFVDVMVTNGGYNGVQTALAHGIPLVAAGKSEDKPEVCARIAWSGVGIDLKTRSPSPQQIRQAVTTVITDPAYRAKAVRLQSEIQRCTPAKTAADLLEQLATTQQPVLRR